MVKKKSKKVLKKKPGAAKSRGINKKLDRILNVENTLLNEEKKVEAKEEQLSGEEKRIESRETKIESEEKSIDGIKKELGKEETDLEQLTRLEKEIKSEVGDHPLAKITLKDIAKGLIGAFIGLAIHYTFVYGVEISKDITITRATMLFPVTFLVGLLFIYATGFRKVKDKKLLMFMPLRLIVLYICALVMSILVLYIFYPNFGESFIDSYKMVAGVMLAAVVGACTADLLGKD